MVYGDILKTDQRHDLPGVVPLSTAETKMRSLKLAEILDLARYLQSEGVPVTREDLVQNLP